MEWTQSKKALVLLCASASIIAISAQSADAAFFALREQSAYSQGASFAGASAQRNALSSSFFNPAIITEFKGFTAEGTASVILPFTDANTSVGASDTGIPAIDGARAATFAGRSTTSNIGSEALLPASYTSKQLNDKLWVGFAVNSPFGLGTRSDPTSFEALSSQEFRAFSLNFQPTVAYKVNERFSIAAGVQGQYIDVKQATALLNGSTSELDANGVSFGFLLGATIKPTDKTTIGIGYRSQMDVDLDGELSLRDASAPGVFTPGVNLALGDASADLALPDIVNVGITHQFTDRFTGLAQFSWENWSRLQTVQVASAAPAAFDFNLSDSFFYSLGGEFKASDHLKLRAGIAYETSPTNEEDRSLALPDNDRLWFSAGGTYKATKHVELDFAATWVRVERDTAVSNSLQVNPAFGPLSGAPIAAGTADSNIFIFSAGTRVRF